MSAGSVGAHLRQWRITNHARDRLADRAIAPTELVEAMLHPKTVKANETGIVQWGRSVGLVWDWDKDAVSGQRVKVIMTVLLSGSTSDTWEQDVIGKAQERETFIDAEALVAELTAGQWTRRPKPKPQGTVASKVIVRNIYDEVPIAMMDTARKLLKQAGFDENDLRRVKVVGRNRLEIDTT